MKYRFFITYFLHIDIYYKMKNIIKFLSRINCKTIFFNLKYLPFRQAIRLPILVSHHVYLKRTYGNITINHPIKTGLIQIGFGDVGIFDRKRSRSVWEVSGSVVFNGKCNLGHGSKISVGNKGVLSLGADLVITAESTIVCYQDIQIGNQCLFSWNILVMDTDLHTIKDENNTIINQPKPIRIGDHVWISSGCTLLKGVSIPKNVVIGAGSTVSKTLVTENAIYVGNPCVKVKENIKWEI